MKRPSLPDGIIIDYITGQQKANRGAEANRQQIERLLVNKRGYRRGAIEVDAPIVLDVNGQEYASTVDLVIRVRGYRFMAIKCAAGSLASRERETIAAARLLDDYQIPLAVATDGKTALVWDTVTAKSLGTGLEAIPSATQADAQFNTGNMVVLEEKRRHRQMLIYRSYDTMNVHR